MWKYGWLVLVILLMAACSKGDAKVPFKDLPQGDAENGAKLFTNGANGTAPCSSCHRIDGTDTTAPSLAGLAGRAGEAVKGQSAGEYAYMSIIRPARHLVQGYSNIMPTDYEQKLTTQQLADLIAYILTL